MPSRPRVLLTTCPTPYPVHPPDRDGIDQYGLRLTKHQGLFQVPIEYPFHPGLHLIARNLPAEVTVLDGPDESTLAARLARRPDIVGISFPTVLIPRALQAARLTRRFAPSARLVLGGHGVLCVASPDLDPARKAAFLVGVVPGSPAALASEELGRIAHAVCRTDGIAFMRELLQADRDAPVDGSLPPTGVLHPFGLDLVDPRNMISLAPALGCSGGCEFCTTGAFFHRRRVLTTPALAHRSIRAQLARIRPGDSAYGVVMDEDLLADRPWIASLGELLATDPAVRETGFMYTTFGSSRSIAAFSPDELLRWRIGNVWIGVETTLARTGVGYLEHKRTGTEKALFDGLHDAGISTNASLIIGWDFHDHASIRADIEAFLALEPTSVQVLPLIPAPGTRLWTRMAVEGRLRPLERWDDMHYYGESFRYLHFTTRELWDLEDEIERRLYQEQGPYFLKLADVARRGLQRLEARRGERGRSEDGLARVLSRLMADLRPTLDSIRALAPTEAVRRKAADTTAAVDRLLGPPALSDRARNAALLAFNRLRGLGLGPQRQYQPRPNETVYRDGRIVASTWGGEAWPESAPAVHDPSPRAWPAEDAA